MKLTWFDDIPAVFPEQRVALNAAPPLGIDGDARAWGNIPRALRTKHAFLVWATPKTHDVGYIGGERFWALAVSPPDDATEEELETAKRTALDLVRLRYGWSE